MAEKLHLGDSKLAVDIENAKTVENRPGIFLGRVVVDLHEYMNRLLDGEKGYCSIIPHRYSF